ncbi:4Fe-4S binding protein [bacterium]|nr:4Fe-4S binding protein [FCB group bacterium]MBL7191321.1 4Fe-4S binding protein [bacterium]
MNENQAVAASADYIEVKRKLCDFCGTCVAVCPVDCIYLNEHDIIIDHDVCNLCMNCVKVCPLHIIYHVEARI